MKEIIASQEELGRVVAYLNEILPDDAIVFLRGDLAAGKTTLVQAIVKAKGNRGLTPIVTSPTFSLQHCYGNGLYHYDLYRLDHDEFMQLGLFEEFEKQGWHLIEWGSDKLKEFLENIGYDVTTVDIDRVDDHRKYIIKSPNA